MLCEDCKNGKPVTAASGASGTNGQCLGRCDNGHAAWMTFQKPTEEELVERFRRLSIEDKERALGLLDADAWD